MITPQNILRHELIGLNVQVTKALNPLSRNIKGEVIDETQQTILIRTKNGDKKLLKRLATFEFDLKKARVEVKGLELIGRSWERIKK
ncbi:ribonuclease P protein subunit [Candidatus Woesearchaeota archaeon]|jgi:ribonuclease P protein subunit POP4|nr:ribonuclease P protein subunit [Candidatus Woesearchaeota archaeon]MBT6023282.1 ribonuclease P protein subunit [Candidatus Woesearchaeota archaeon]|tara:strand:+ start:134 stop:394 length:261 start_codon:yes stop_codon:yes gene_type:complete